MAEPSDTSGPESGSDMDDSVLQDWSDALTELREKRAADVSAAQGAKPDFGPPDFYNVAVRSLDEILDRWLQFEKMSASPDAELMKGELESVFEFEMEAIDRDLAAARESATWDAGQQDAARASFESTAGQLKQKYALKIAAPSPALPPAPPAAGKPAPAKKAEPVPAKFSGGSGGGSSRTGGAVMFLVGLLLGAGPSVYFWDLSRKQGRAGEEERAKLVAEKRALEDSMTLLHGRFDQLASGEIKSLPEIERTVERIRKEADEKKKAAEAAYAKERARLVKRVPAGARLDRLLAALEEKRNGQISEIEAAAAQAVEPFEKQKATLQEMRAG